MSEKICCVPRKEEEAFSGPSDRQIIESGKKNAETQVHLEAFQFDNEKSRRWDVTNGLTVSDTSFYKFLFERRIPRIELSSLSIFPVVSELSSSEFCDMARRRKSEMELDSSKMLGNGTVLISSKNGDFVSEMWFKPGTYVPSKVSVSIIKSGDAENLYECNYKYIEKSGVFVPVHIDISRIVYSKDMKTDVTFPVTELGSITFEWTHENVEKLEIPAIEDVTKSGKILEALVHENVEK